jgi:polyisoprenoid-binding protein YceI
MKKTVFLAVSLMVGVVLAAPAEFTPTGVITYEAAGPVGKWKGTNKAFSGKLTYDRDSSKIAGSVCVATKAWNSGEGIRDGHTRDMFEVEKFPTACFAPESLEGDVKAGKVTILGKLTIHGVTQAIKLIGTAKDDGAKVSFTGAITLKVTDYKMNRPSILGFTVADEVPVTISAEASTK